MGIGEGLRFVSGKLSAEMGEHERGLAGAHQPKWPKMAQNGLTSFLQRVSSRGQRDLKQALIQTLNGLHGH